MVDSTIDVLWLRVEDRVDSAIKVDNLVISEARVYIDERDNEITDSLRAK